MTRTFTGAALAAATLFCALSTPALAAAQSGKASWYGPGFHGRTTANGERYDQNAYTAAHKSLKFGTRICVRNLRNGKGVTLRINDRGPFVRGRVVDVSKRAANRLGMMRSGVIPVRVSVVGSKAKSGASC
jgi:rare lipoprotein A